MRNSFLKLKQDGKSLLDAESMLQSREGPQSAGNDRNIGQTDNSNGIGMIVERGEFGLGIAPRESKPIHKIELTKEQEAEIHEAQCFEPDAESTHEDMTDTAQAFIAKSKENSKMKKRKDLNKQEAFLEFKEMDEGKLLEESIRDNRFELKDIKVKVKDLTEKCNISKKNIDSVKTELDKKQDERKQGMGQLNGVDEADIDDNDAPQEIIDEEELAMLTHLKDLKKAYRGSFQDLKAVKTQVHNISASIDHAKQQLVSQFEDWYDENFETEGDGLLQKSTAR